MNGRKRNVRVGKKREKKEKKKKYGKRTKQNEKRINKQTNKRKRFGLRSNVGVSYRTTREIS